MKTNYEKAIKLMAKYSKNETVIRNCNGDSEMIDIVNKINYRKQNEAVITVKNFCDNLIKNRLTKIAKALPDEGYSMGSLVTVSFNKIIGESDRRQYYSNSCSYHELHGRIKLNLSLTELTRIKVIGGLATYIYSSRNKVKKCYWYDSKGSKNRFELIKQYGYIFKDFHALTKIDALNGGMHTLNLIKELENHKKKYQKALRMQYVFQDSLNAGNCEAGTRAFVMRLRLNPEKKYRGTFLIKEAKLKCPESVTYVERMISRKLI